MQPNQNEDEPNEDLARAQRYGFSDQLAALSIDAPAQYNSKLASSGSRILRRYGLSVKAFGQEPVDEWLDLVNNELNPMAYFSY